NTAGTAEAGPDARVEAAAVGWESWAEGVRERAAARVPAVDPPTIDQGQRLFARFRAAQHDLVSQLEASSSSALSITSLANWVKVLVVGVGAAVIGVLLGVSARSFVRHGFGPLRELADAAGQIAVEGHSSIPHVDSEDGVGELARALQAW